MKKGQITKKLQKVMDNLDNKSKKDKIMFEIGEFLLNKRMSKNGEWDTDDIKEGVKLAIDKTIQSRNQKIIEEIEKRINIIKDGCGNKFKISFRGQFPICGASKTLGSIGLCLVCKAKLELLEELLKSINSQTENSEELEKLSSKSDPAHQNNKAGEELPDDWSMFKNNDNQR